MLHVLGGIAVVYLLSLIFVGAFEGADMGWLKLGLGIAFSVLLIYGILKVLV